jgi:glycine oxidase
MSAADASFDTIIVGGGVIGCAIAWRLAQARQRVALVERHEPGREASWAAGGMLAAQAEADQADAFLELALASRALYASFAKELLTTTGINIEYRTEGTLYLALTETDEVELEHRWQWQHAAGLNTKKLTRDCTRKLEPQLNDKLRWALKFPDDHQVNARQLVTALIAAARQAGVATFSNTEAQHVITSGKQVQGVATNKGELHAATTILTAGAWTSQLTQAVPTGPVRGQMVALPMTAPPLRHVVYSCRSYLVPRAAGFLIAGSTTEHTGFEKATTKTGIASIVERSCEIIPSLGQTLLLETWAGLRPKNALDDWPVIGVDANYRGLLYATGHYRNGILLTPITAQVVSELVLGGNPSINLSAFSPARFA